MTMFTTFIRLTRLTAMLAAAWTGLRMLILAQSTNLQNISGKAHAGAMLFFLHLHARHFISRYSDRAHYLESSTNLKDHR